MREVRRLVFTVVLASVILVIVGFASISSQSSDREAEAACGFPAEGTAIYVGAVAIRNGAFPVGATDIVATLSCDGLKFSPQTLVTNASGYISISSPDGSSYDFSLVFNHHSYQFNGTIKPLQSTYLLLLLPIGTVQQRICNDMASTHACSTLLKQATVLSQTGSSSDVNSSINGTFGHR